MNKKCGYKYRLLSWALLCSLLFGACGQEAEAPQEDAAAPSETMEENIETEEAEDIVAAPDEAAMPDLSGARNAEEALELLIEDEGFRRCVCLKYGGCDISDGDSPEVVWQKLQSCESLELKEPGRNSSAIYSLEALALLPNLKYLVIDIDPLDDSVITDYTPIAQLSQLESLSISYKKNGSLELSCLGEMSTITELYLTQSTIEDISFLGEMPQLQRLSLYETHVEDLAVLEKLPELVELSLTGNEDAKNIEAVGTLTKLQDLELRYCGIGDISFLSGLTELRDVNLNGNSITDITPLAGLVKLEKLGLAENNISDISALQHLEQIYILALRGNEIRDISALAQLPRLNQVELSDNLIEDLTPLAGKEELVYVDVFGNPIKSLEPVWDVPLLWWVYRGVSDEEETFIADWLAEHYPEVEEFSCADFKQGDLNNDGRQDIAFVVSSDAFQPENSDIAEDRRMFILLQQNDGSWAEQMTLHIMSAQSGGMRGDPYYGACMMPGYLVIAEGWGSRDGTEMTVFYEYQNGSLNLVKQIEVGDDNFAYGYDVEVTNMQDDTWQKYVIAMDGDRMVRVDLADSEHVAHKAFPRINLLDGTYYVHNDKVESQITSSEALDRALEAVVKDTASAVREDLPYAEWQKEGYERLLGVTLPDHYYILPIAETETDVEDRYLRYEGVTWEDGRLCHKIALREKVRSSYGTWERSTEYLLDDDTGEIIEG